MLHRLVFTQFIESISEQIISDHDIDQESTFVCENETGSILIQRID